MILYASILIFLYLTLRFILPLPVSRTGKWILTLLFLVISQYHHVLRWHFGTLAAAELPVPVLLCTSWLFISLILLFVFQLIRDLGGIVLALLRKLTRFPGPIFAPLLPRRITALLLCCISMALSAYGEREAVRVPDVREVDAILPGLPRELDGAAIVQISDLHVSPLLNAPRVRAVVDKANALQADLILLTGDMTDGRVERRTQDVAPLKDLRAAFGVFACEGNHEYYSGYAEWREAFARLDLPVLRNEHKVVNVRGVPVVLAGVTDPVAERFDLPMPDAEKAFAGAPEGLFRVLMAHQPGKAGEYARAGVDLMLSGHTHGGQIRGFDDIVAARNNGFVRGWYTVDAMRLYVSTGAGLWNGFPVRLGVPSEIARITLRSGAAPELP